MDTFLKATAGVLITIILGLVLSKEAKHISLLLTIAACCMIGAAAMKYLEPVVVFLDKLQFIGNLNTEMLQILLKTVGIGMLAELASMICTDSGNAALGKMVQILSSCVILWMSVPLLTELIELVENILSTA